MQHPDPLYLCRHIMLVRLNPDGTHRPYHSNIGPAQAVFRRNTLNPTTAWDKPVPRIGETLVFDKFIIPLAHYLPALEATCHFASDHRPFDILPTNASVLTATDPLRDFNPRGAGGVGGLGTAEYQDKLRTLRDNAVCEMVRKLMSKNTDPTLKAREVADRAIEQIAPRIRLSPASIWKILHKREGFTTAPERKPRAKPADPPPFKLSTAYEHMYKYRRLCDAVQVARSNDKTLGVFSIHHLAVRGQPGGYPETCPVSGLELEWGEDPSSMYSPKLALRSVLLGRPGTLPIEQDVVMVSKAAKRILEGTGAVDTMARFMANKPDHLLIIRKWLEDNEANDAPISNLKKVIQQINVLAKESDKKPTKRRK